MHLFHSVHYYFIIIIYNAYCFYCCSQTADIYVLENIYIWTILGQISIDIGWSNCVCVSGMCTCMFCSCCSSRCSIIVFLASASSSIAPTSNTLSRYAWICTCSLSLSVTVNFYTRTHTHTHARTHTHTHTKLFRLHLFDQKHSKNSKIVKHS